jgi:hypothetical protein
MEIAMRPFHTALAAVAFSSSLAGSEALFGPWPGQSIRFVSARHDAQRIELVYAVMDNARDRIASAHRSLEPISDPTTALVMDAAVEAIRADARRQLAVLLEPDEVDALLDQSSSL